MIAEIASIAIVAITAVTAAGLLIHDWMHPETDAHLRRKS